MEMAMVRMDEKFRIVIPKRLRRATGIHKKTNFHIYATDNLLFLRQVKGDEIPSEIEQVRRAFGPAA